MFGFKVGNQHLFGSVPFGTLPAPVPLFLPTGFQMEVPHGCGGENLAAAATRPARFSGVCLHMMF